MLSSKTILMISSSYPQNLDDWKSVFIRQLMDALSEHSQIKVKYWGPPGPMAEGISYACPPNEAEWLRQLMEQGGIIHLFRQNRIKSLSAIIRMLWFLGRTYRRYRNIGLLHINWLQNALPLWGTKQSVVISVLGSDLGLLKLPGMSWLLRQAIKKRQCVLTPNAEWMKDILLKEFGDLARVVFIPLGIDKAWYEVRRDHMPSSPRNWIVISRLTRKKIGPLFEWGKDIFSNARNYKLNLFGPMQEKITLPEWVQYHGPTHGKVLREHWFPKATGLISLSWHDEGRPQIMLEAMAAGLPIIASRIPAHENFIAHRQTGWLVSSIDDFVDGVKWLTETKNNASIAKHARRWVRQNVGTWADCAQRYLRIYDDLLSME